MQSMRFVAKALRRGSLVVLGCVAAAALLTSSVPAPTSSIASIKIHSDALGGALPVNVYVPASRVPGEGWPVLYLLHGLGGSERDWVELGGIKATLDRMIRSGRIRPMMVVMPGAGSSWYVDSAQLGGPGDFESAIGDDLPRAIEARFPVSESASQRAIAGVSMGGYGALRIALKRPESFAAVASMSGALWHNLPMVQESLSGEPYNKYRDQTYFHRVDDATVVQGINLPPAGSHFGKAFGAPFDADRFNTQNVFTLLASQIARGKALPAIFLTVGDDDSKNLWRGSMTLYNTLRADQQRVEFRVTDGDHTWALWKRSIEDTLLFVNSRLGSGGGGVIAHSGAQAAS
jgi:S-formylglutathione hydrolase FrmB